MRTIRFPVEWGHVVTFGRAVGADPSSYEDPASAVAPPTFVVASTHFDPDHPLRPRNGEPWFGSGRAATGAPATEDDDVVLHAEQHFEHHRPVRPGEVLHVVQRPGETWVKESSRSGRLEFAELLDEYRDERGELVVTARAVTVRVPRSDG